MAARGHLWIDVPLSLSQTQCYSTYIAAQAPLDAGV
jgi:hypothetical protein